jgi:hypothetical protein
MPQVVRRWIQDLQLWQMIVLIIAIKWLLLRIDHTPRVFLGDSRSYIYTALNYWVPNDRSYVYGILIRIVTGSSHSLYNLILLQTACMTVVSLSVAVTARRYFGAAVWLAGVAGIACAIEPLQLMAERFVMSEPPALCLFALYATLAFRYLKHGGFLPILVMPVLAVAVVSFRVAFLPCILFTAVAIPLMSPRALRLYRLLGQDVRRPAVHRLRIAVLLATELVLSIGLTQFGLARYQSWYGRISNGPPGYIQTDGLVLMSDMAPIVNAADFPDPEMGKRVLAKVTIDLKDPKMRMGQHFSPGGLVDVLVRDTSPKLRLVDVNQLARRIAISAMVHHPMDLARLVWTTVLLYFDRATLRAALRYDEFRDATIDATALAYSARSGTQLRCSRRPVLS